MFLISTDETHRGGPADGFLGFQKGPMMKLRGRIPLLQSAFIIPKLNRKTAMNGSGDE